MELDGVGLGGMVWFSVDKIESKVEWDVGWGVWNGGTHRVDRGWQWMGSGVGWNEVG